MNDEWVRPAPGDKTQIWGFKRGIQVGIWPADIERQSDGGPRGLFRIGYPILDGGKSPGLVNFVAVEPVVGGRRGFSELEPSKVSEGRGKRFWSGDPAYERVKNDPGWIFYTPHSEALVVDVYIEPFENGAAPIVQISFRSDRPEEVRFTVRSADSSAKMDRCVLTATMGNYMRLRQLHLTDHIVHPRDLWPNYNGKAFTEDAFMAAHLFPKDSAGDLVVCATTDEKDPHAQPADPTAPWWKYRGSFPLTQYWRRAKGGWTNALRVRVNGRVVYWAGELPIPGGMAFENFDLVEPFVENQEFIFGLTRRSPSDLVARTVEQQARGPAEP